MNKLLADDAEKVPQSWNINNFPSLVHSYSSLCSRAWESTRTVWGTRRCSSWSEESLFRRNSSFCRMFERPRNSQERSRVTSAKGDERGCVRGGAGKKKERRQSSSARARNERKMESKLDRNGQFPGKDKRLECVPGWYECYDWRGIKGKLLKKVIEEYKAV